jgi:replicative DNA helicase
MKRGTDISPLSVLLGRIDAVADGAPPHETIPTGFPSVDRLLGGGIRRGDLIALGGDVSSGKSALALAIALRVAEGKRNVAFFSGEMSRERVMERALAIEGRARIDDLRAGSLDEAGRAAVGAAAIRLREVLPRFEPIPADGTAALGEFVDQSSRVELLVVDSLQSLTPRTGARSPDEELASTIPALKRLAIDLDVAVLVTAHLPRLEARTDHRPRLDDFGALGAVKHHADVVLGLFREEMYEASRGNAGATELLVLKNRNGSTGYVDLYFYSQWMRFEDMLDPDR